MTYQDLKIDIYKFFIIYRKNSDPKSNNTSRIADVKILIIILRLLQIRF